MTTRIRVETAKPYDVVVGKGVLGDLAYAIGPSARRVAIIHPKTLADRAADLREGLVSQGFDASTLTVPDAEAAKTAGVLAGCWGELGRWGFTRSDVIVGLGGGATTDLAGFVAATWLRGVRVVQIPSTILGMVDAAVGGKTGINTAEGKNLVGAFHEPAAVLCDLTLLDTLPADEYVPGLAEVVKCGFIADPAILDLIEGSFEDAVRPNGALTHELVERAIRVKATVVAGDLTESAAMAGGGPGREVLNYGHTLAHAIERRERYRWRHGNAVSVGMVFAAELGRVSGRLDEATAVRHRTVLEGLGLPTTYEKKGAGAKSGWPELLATMRLDKKTRGDLLRFIVLDGLARPELLEGPSEDLLRAAFAAVIGD